jgi:uncharacterized protein YfaA (DUF2138 family)
MDDLAMAKWHHLEALKLFADAEDVSAPVLIFSGLAAVAREEGDMLRAARLAGASEAQEAASGAGLGSVVGSREGWRPSGVLPAEQEAARAEGKAMTLQQSIAYALDGSDAASTVA